jgi:hypothetical protein
MIYQLTYELITPDKDYTPLYHLLETEISNEAIHVLRDTWWLNVDDSVSVDSLCEAIREKMGETDTFVLTQLSDTNTNGWLSASSWKWRRNILNEK